MDKYLKEFLLQDLVNIVRDYNTIKKREVKWFKQMLLEELDWNIKFIDEVKRGDRDPPTLLVAVKDKIYTEGIEGEWGSNTIHFTLQGKALRWCMNNLP